MTLMIANPYVSDFRNFLRNRFSDDAVSMLYSEWVERNTTLNRKPFSFKGYEFQRAILDDMSEELSVIKPSQVGLALDLDTPIKTTTGWSTMGDLQIGDWIYDERGQPCSVTYLSPIYTDHPCYEITFDTGETIVADENHRWPVAYGLKTTAQLEVGDQISHSEVTIHQLTPVPPRPVRCLTVDSPNHLFLAGRGMIPTHNTEIQLRKVAAFVTRNQGTSAIFTLPDTLMYERVSKTRFGPMLEADQAFNPPANGRPIRRTDLYQIGGSYIYFTGGVEGAATSIPADMLAHDEIDLMDQEIVALFQSRLQGSQHRITHRFSTPTFEGYGIDAHFSVSNQNEYLAKCSSCARHSIPKWSPKHVHLHGLSADIEHFKDITQDIYDSLDLSPDKSFVICEHCGAQLDLTNPDLREWVPRHPQRSAKGYAVTPFATANLGPRYILKQQMLFFRNDAHRRFYNTVLGESYDDVNARLSEVEVRKMLDSPSIPELPDGTAVVIGVDVGLQCHIVVKALLDPKPVYLMFLTVPVADLTAFLDTLFDQYNVVGGAVDRYPYTPLSNDIRDRYNGLIMPVEYAEAASTHVDIKTDELGQQSYARGNRTSMVDTVVSEIRKGAATYHGYGDQGTILVQHFRSMVRIEQADKPAKWVKTDGIDHYMHAMAYCNFAIKIHNLQNHSTDTDQRTNFGVVKRSIPNQSGDNLGMVRGIPRPI